MCVYEDDGKGVSDAKPLYRRRVHASKVSIKGRAATDPWTRCVVVVAAACV